MLFLIIIALLLVFHPRLGGWGFWPFRSVWPFGGWWHRPPMGGMGGMPGGMNRGPGRMDGMPSSIGSPGMGGHMRGPVGMGGPGHR